MTRRMTVLNRTEFASTLNTANPKNKCRNCGRKLQPLYKFKYRAPTPTEAATGAIYIAEITGHLGFGTRGNNFFCTQACGFKFSLRVVK